MQAKYPLRERSFMDNQMSTFPINIQEAVCSATWLDCFNYNLDISLLIKDRVLLTIG